MRANANSFFLRPKEIEAVPNPSAAAWRNWDCLAAGIPVETEWRSGRCGESDSCTPFDHLSKGGSKMQTRRSRCVLWAVALVSIGLFAGGARAAFYSEQYEMTFSPDTVAGTVNGFTLGVAAGTGTLGPSG